MSIANFSRCTLGSYAVIIMLAGCGESHSPAVPQLSPIIMYAIPHTSKKTFHYTGAAQTFTVPAHVTELTVTAAGASGASGGPSSGYGGQGGMGGLVRATIPVKSGESLRYRLPAAAMMVSTAALPAAVRAATAVSAERAGVPQIVRQNGASLDDRVIVAGGGGGGAVGNAPNAGGDGAPGGASVSGRGRTPGVKRGRGLRAAEAEAAAGGRMRVAKAAQVVRPVFGRRRVRR